MKKQKPYALLAIFGIAILLMIIGSQPVEISYEEYLKAVVQKHECYKVQVTKELVKGNIDIELQLVDAELKKYDGQLKIRVNEPNLIFGNETAKLIFVVNYTTLNKSKLPRNYILTSYPIIEGTNVAFPRLPPIFGKVGLIMLNATKVDCPKNLTGVNND